MPLIERYQGPLWLSLKVALRGAIAQPHIVVLSGKYGICSAHARTPNYNARLSRDRADLLIERGASGLNDHFGEVKGGLLAPSPCAVMRRPAIDGYAAAWSRVVICGGAEYRRVFQALCAEMQRTGVIAADADIRCTQGGIGEQRQQLAAWVRAVCVPPTDPELDLGQLPMRHVNGC